MFEKQQEGAVDELIAANAEFRRLYSKHQDLDRQVNNAETGSDPVEDLTLHQLKKEKLWAKDRLTTMMDTFAHAVS